MRMFEYTEEDYLRDQLERYREADERQSRERELERVRKQQERKEHYESEMRSADTWPEALGKQAALFRREAAQWTAEDDPDEFFGPGAKACDRALELWSVVESEKQPSIEALQAQIDDIRESIRLETADRLEADSNSTAWRMVAIALREESIENWLNW